MTQAAATPSATSPPRLRSHQLRVFWLLWGAYAAYYLCRVNFAVAQPAILKEFPSWTAAQVGSIPSIYALFYAVGQIVNGTLGQRYGARRMMTLALVMAALTNFLFFFVSSFHAMRVLCAINGWFQSAGWALMVHVISNWNTSARRGFLIGRLSTCYQVGNVLSLQSRYDRALSRLESAALSQGPLLEILGALGLAEFPLETPLTHLSGGQKTRMALAGLLLGEPGLLLLDEPTNHLDLDMLAWLEEWLDGYRGAALIVSHDRAFLDNTVHEIIDLDPTTHATRQYRGNYSEYLEQYQEELEKQEAQYHAQMAEIGRMQQDIQRTKQQALNVELTTSSRQPGVRHLAKKLARKPKSREKKLERYQESGELVEKPKLTLNKIIETANVAIVDTKT